MRNNLCINCKNNTKFLFSKIDKNTRKKYKYFECKKCRLIAIFPFPSQKPMYKFPEPYSYFVSQNPQAKLITSLPFGKFIVKKYLELSKNRAGIVERIKKSGRILDIGCSSGGFLRLFGNKWQPYGLEVNTKVAKEAKKNVPKAKIYTGKIEDIKLPPNYFDVVTMWHVLEHLQHPRQILKKTYGILKPNGYLIIEVPNAQSIYRKLFGANWQLLLTPEHLYFYSQKSLKELLIKEKFKIKATKHVATFSPSPVSSLANFLRSKGFASNLAILISLCALPVILMVNLLAFSNRENLLIIAKK